jgi:hypothetical protein
LALDEHEAFYFLFSAPTGRVFGFLRVLFGHDSVLELFALRLGDHTWLHERRTMLPGDSRLSGDASGPVMTLTCQTPWQAWRCLFRAPLQEVGGESVLEADVDLTFTATNVPALYRFGSYHQAQQDGRLCGRLQIGTESCPGDLICYRDHSWGTRPMGAASGWTIASAPDHFYIVVVDMGEQQVHWGRFTRPEKDPTPVHSPQVTNVNEGWRIKDPEAGMETLDVQRLAPPLTAFLGTAGQETIRDAPRPEDLYSDCIGPALFLFPDGKQVAGFMDQARRLS